MTEVIFFVSTNLLNKDLYDIFFVKANIAFQEGEGLYITYQLVKVAFMGITVLLIMVFCI